jgi:hypothetical protein
VLDVEGSDSGAVCGATPVTQCSEWADQGSFLGRGREFLSSPLRPDRLWGHPACCPLNTGG